MWYKIRPLMIFESTTVEVIELYSMRVRWRMILGLFAGLYRWNKSFEPEVMTVSLGL